MGTMKELYEKVSNDPALVKKFSELLEKMRQKTIQKQQMRAYWISQKSAVTR